MSPALAFGWISRRKERAAASGQWISWGTGGASGSWTRTEGLSLRTSPAPLAMTTSSSPSGRCASPISSELSSHRACPSPWGASSLPIRHTVSPWITRDRWPGSGVTSSTSASIRERLTAAIDAAAARESDIDPAVTETFPRVECQAASLPPVRRVMACAPGTLRTSQPCRLRALPTP